MSWGVEGAEPRVSPADALEANADGVPERPSKAGSGLTEAGHIGGLDLRVCRHAAGVDSLWVEGGLVARPDHPLDHTEDPRMLAKTPVLPLTTAPECEKDIQVRFTVRAFDDSQGRRQPSRVRRCLTASP